MEFTVHLIIWVAAVFYSIYNVFLFTKRLDASIKDLTEDFTDGWPVIGRLKDVSDYEWNTWKSFAVDLSPWLFSHFCGAEFFRQTHKYSPKFWYIFVSFSLILYKFGPIYFLFLILQPCIYLLILQRGGKSRSIWVSSCLILIVINILKKYYENLINHNAFVYRDISHEAIYMIMISLSWIHLRCLSYSLEVTESIDIKEKQLNINRKKDNKTLDMLSYVFYLPLFFLGPVILYNDFEKSFSIPFKSTLKWRLLCFVKNFTRYMGWFLFIEFCLHFIYFNALQYYAEMVTMMPDWCLYGGGLWMGLYFYLKYLIVYGMSGTLTALDHIEPETPPRCIARVHRYSQMWKYFDVGLHKFLIRYIYKPVIQGIEKHNVIWLSFMRAFASLICFTFVFFWHGAHGFILIWTILNYLGIVMESVGTTISQSALYIKLRTSILKTDSMNDNFNAFLSTPILIISALSNFYFFAGSEIGNIYVQRVLDQSFYSFIIMFTCLYSSCRVSQFLNLVNARKVLT